MYVKEVTVENQVGLHARPATFFIQKANEFKSSIWVEKEERRVNAKSLLGVLYIFKNEKDLYFFRTDVCHVERYLRSKRQTGNWIWIKLRNGN